MTSTAATSGLVCGRSLLLSAHDEPRERLIRAALAREPLQHQQALAQRGSGTRDRPDASRPSWSVCWCWWRRSQVSSPNSGVQLSVILTVT